MNAPDEQAITQSDLMAYADGQLDDARRAAVEAYFADHPEAAAEVEAFTRQNEAIAALYAPVAAEPVPARLSPAAIARDVARSRAGLWRMAAAAALVFAIGLGSGYALRGPGAPVLAPDDRLIAAAVDAHQLFVTQKVHPVEVAATQRTHLTNWLSNSLDRRLVMPDLELAGLTLVGGRLLPSADSAAAQVMYETTSGDRVTLYITPRAEGDSGATRYESVGPLSALYWATSTLTCTIVGDLSRPEMEAVAHAVFDALKFGDESYPLGRT